MLKIDSKILVKVSMPDTEWIFKETEMLEGD